MSKNIFEIFKRSDNLPFERSFTDGASYKKYRDVLSQNTNKTSQLFRGNHGGGFPCPDNICESSEFSENY